jgi:hypothetical protein
MHVQLTSHHIAEQSKPFVMPGHTYFIALPREKLIASVDDRHKCEIIIQERHVPILTEE